MCNDVSVSDMSFTRDDFLRLLDRKRIEFEAGVTRRAQDTVTFIRTIQKYLKFIETKILVLEKMEITSKGIEYRHEYYFEDGIPVYLQTKSSDLNVPLPFTDIFPHTTGDAQYRRHDFRGIEVYLVKSGRFLYFTRESVISEQKLMDPNGCYFALTIPEETSARELVAEYPDFFEVMQKYLKNAVINAIQRDQNNRFVLRGLIDYINKKDLIKIKEQEYLNALEKSPNDPQLCMEFAVFSHQQLGNIAQADHYFKRAMQVQPINKRFILEYLDFLETTTKDRDHAKAVLTQAIRTNPSDFELKMRLAELWMWMKREELQAFKKDPNYATILESYYSELLDAAPDDAWVHESYAFFLYWVKKDENNAWQHFEYAIELEPGILNHYLNYASLLQLVSSDHKKISDLYTKAIALFPDRADTYLFYALYLQRSKKDFKAAAEAFEKSIALDPIHCYSYLKYAEFLIVSNKLDDAERNLRTGIECAADDDSHLTILQILLASLLYLTGKVEEAHRMVDRFMVATNSDEYLLLGYAMKYIHYQNPQRRADMLKHIRYLIKKGIYFKDDIGGEITKHINDGILKGHPEPEFLRALGFVIAGAKSADSLDKFPVWNA
jgi:tetratricopeptide (TPR) repeat protein